MQKMVLFDCDGVLINTEEVGYHIIKDMLADHNISYSRTEFVELLSGITYEAFHDKLRQEHPELPADFHDNMDAAIDAAFQTQVKVIDGVKDLLERLKNENIPFAVCSNSGGESLLYKLKHFGLYDYFAPHIYSRHHVENEKPAPDMYLQAAGHRSIKPENCIVVEDSVTGTKAGVAAGMKVIGFVGESHRDDGEADLLEKAGAKMIALDMTQVWDHIAQQTGLDLKFPYLNSGLEL